MYFIITTKLVKTAGKKKDSLFSKSSRNTIGIFLTYSIFKGTRSQSKMKTICFPSQGNYWYRHLQISLEKKWSQNRTVVSSSVLKKEIYATHFL